MMTIAKTERERERQCLVALMARRHTDAGRVYLLYLHNIDSELPLANSEHVMSLQRRFIVIGLTGIL